MRACHKVEQPLPFAEWNVGEVRCRAESSLVEPVPLICRFTHCSLGELTGRLLHFNVWDECWPSPSPVGKVVKGTVVMVPPVFLFFFFQEPPKF